MATSPSSSSLMTRMFFRSRLSRCRLGRTSRRMTHTTKDANQPRTLPIKDVCTNITNSFLGRTIVLLFLIRRGSPHVAIRSGNRSVSSLPSDRTQPDSLQAPGTCQKRKAEQLSDGASFSAQEGYPTGAVFFGAFAHSENLPIPVLGHANSDQREDLVHLIAAAALQPKGYGKSPNGRCRHSSILP